MDVRFTVTEAGRRAWESKDVAVPSDYRLILWMLDFHGSDHTGTFLDQFPQQFLQDCLLEMEELRLIERIAGGASGPAELRTVSILAISESELPDATTSLASAGAYVSAERMKSRAPTSKAPSELKILIVEDDPDQLALADLRVSMAGYSVQVADSQSAMLRRLARDVMPDTILLDVMLPDGSGFDILRKLRRLPSFSALPIVLLTAKTTSRDIVEGLKLGADGYITKPYSKDVLVRVLDQILGR